MLSLRTSNKWWPWIKRKVGFQSGSEPWLAGSPAPSTLKGPSFRARCGQLVRNRLLVPQPMDTEFWAES